jgi:hypothetical protein
MDPKKEIITQSEFKLLFDQIKEKYCSQVGLKSEDFEATVAFRQEFKDSTLDNRSCINDCIANHEAIQDYLKKVKKEKPESNDIKPWGESGKLTVNSKFLQDKMAKLKDNEYFSMTFPQAKVWPLFLGFDNLNSWKTLKSPSNVGTAETQEQYYRAYYFGSELKVDYFDVWINYSFFPCTCRIKGWYSRQAGVPVLKGKGTNYTEDQVLDFVVQENENKMPFHLQVHATQEPHSLSFLWGFWTGRNGNGSLFAKEVILMKQHEHRSNFNDAQESQAKSLLTLRKDATRTSLNNENNQIITQLNKIPVIESWGVEFFEHLIRKDFRIIGRRNDGTFFQSVLSIDDSLIGTLKSSMGEPHIEQKVFFEASLAINQRIIAYTVAELRPRLGIICSWILRKTVGDAIYGTYSHVGSANFTPSFGRICLFYEPDSFDSLEKIRSLDPYSEKDFIENDKLKKVIAYLKDDENWRQN